MGTITININGAPHQEFSKAKSIKDIVISLGFNPDTVVVEHNNTILARNTLHTCHCNHNDSLEIIRYIGGGSKLAKP